jgi:hypothetical protein
MGIESTSACNRLNAIALAEKGESGFRTSSVLMIFGVSHAQRPPRQRLSSNALLMTEVVGETYLPLERNADRCRPAPLLSGGRKRLHKVVQKLLPLVERVDLHALVAAVEADVVAVEEEALDAVGGDTSLPQHAAIGRSRH